MPERQTVRRARQHKRRGHKASTQAGEYVREEMHHKRSGKHRVKNRKQAIAIGLSKARRSGVKVGKKRAAGKTSRKRSRSGSRKSRRS
jgi:hypothetical protein